MAPVQAFSLKGFQIELGYLAPETLKYIYYANTGKVSVSRFSPYAGS